MAVAVVKGDALFMLIKSMTKAEKRFFKIYFNAFAEGHESVNMKLYDLLEGMDAYDEKLLLKKLNDRTIQKNLASYKSKLVDVILRCLQAMGEASSIEFANLQKLLSLKLLYTRKVYELCKKELKQLKQTATEFEDYLLLLDIVNFQRTMIFDLRYDEKDGVTLEKLLEEENEYRQKMANYNRYYHFYSLQKLLLVKKGWNSKESLIDKELVRITGDELFKSPDKALSVKAKYLYYIILQNHYNLLFDSRNSFAINKQFLQFAKEHETYFTTNRVKWMTVIYYYLLSASDVNEFDDYRRELKRLENVEVKGVFPGMAKAVYCNITGITYEITHGSLAGMQNLANKSLADLEEFKQIIRPDVRSQILLLCAIGLMKYGRYDDAFPFLSLLTNESEKEIRPEILAIAKCMQIYFHLERKDYEFIDNLARSALRYNKASDMWDVVLADAISLARIWAKSAGKKGADEVIAHIREIAPKQTGTFKLFANFLVAYINRSTAKTAD